MSRPDAKKNITTLVSGPRCLVVGLATGCCSCRKGRAGVVVMSAGVERGLLSCVSSCSHSLPSGPDSASSQVRAYGENRALREIANLVLVMVSGGVGLGVGVGL